MRRGHKKENSARNAHSESLNQAAQARESEQLIIRFTHVG